MKDNLKNKIIFLQVLLASLVILTIMVAMSVGRGPIRFGLEVEEEKGEEVLYGQIEEFGEEVLESTGSGQPSQDY